MTATPTILDILQNERHEIRRRLEQERREAMVLLDNCEKYILNLRRLDAALECLGETSAVQELPTNGASFNERHVRAIIVWFAKYGGGITPNEIIDLFYGSGLPGSLSVIPTTLSTFVHAQFHHLTLEGVLKKFDDGRFLTNGAVSSRITTFSVFVDNEPHGMIYMPTEVLEAFYGFPQIAFATFRRNPRFKDIMSNRNVTLRMDSFNVALYLIT